MNHIDRVGVDPLDSEAKRGVSALFRGQDKIGCPDRKAYLKREFLVPFLLHLSQVLPQRSRVGAVVKLFES